MSFTVLTGAARTSQAQVVGVVAANARSAYDILVRPRGASTEVEQTRGLVQDNYLSGVFGGITLDQYHAIEQIPGVQVAAPIANLGYYLIIHVVHVDLHRWLTGAPVQLFRVVPAYVSNGGLTSVRDADHYVYVTRVDKMTHPSIDTPSEITSNGTPYTPCQGLTFSQSGGASSAFDSGYREGIDCFSTRTPTRYDPTVPSSDPTGFLGADIYVGYPVLLSAVDPVQENQLVGLAHTITSGRGLNEADSATLSLDPSGGAPTPTVPVIATTRSFLAEELQLRIDQLTVPTGTNVPKTLSSQSAAKFLADLSGTAVGHTSVDLASQFAGSLPDLNEFSQTFSDYWATGPVRYQTRPDGSLQAGTTTNPASVWANGTLVMSGYNVLAPIDNTDTQFRTLTEREGNACGGGTCMAPGVLYPAPNLDLVGRFDPNLLPGFNALSAVPLESYRPPVVEPADPASRRALHGQALAPTMNIGGYLSQPPGMLTTLSAVFALTHSRTQLDPTAQAPISVIRIRVAGVTGVDPLSRARLDAVATAIRQRTGLDVDITQGSSPATQIIHLPATIAGAPPLTVSEGWTKKGVALAIITAVDRKSALLFGLILIVCALFAANAATAAVRARRGELGVLSALGWPASAIFAVVLGELAGVGLIAGVLGTLIGWPVAAALGLANDPTRLALITPVAVLVAVAAGLRPSWLAARATPADAIRPAITQTRRPHSPRTLIGLARLDLTRTPTRTMLAALSLTLGVAALTVLLAISVAFRGIIVGNLLGDAVAIQIRGVDYIAVIAVLALGAASIADVLYLNVRERATELATLHAIGWNSNWLTRLIGYEAVGIGLLGSLTGALIGLAITSILAPGQTSQLLAPAALAAAVGVALAVLGAIAPAIGVRQLPVTQLLASDT